MSEYYRRNGKPYLGGVLEWAKDFETADRRVDRTELKNGLVVSTVFLGLNHNYGLGKPLIFETMVFDDGGKVPKADNDMKRYSTEEEAKIGHEIMVKKWR